jgi:Family of unknown function (DUF6091)
MPTPTLPRCLLAAAGLLMGASAHADNPQRLCVYDLLGASGGIYAAAKDFAVAALKQNVNLEVKAYTDERVATEDYRTGQCDGVMATAFRTRQFNAVSGVIDSLGSSTILKDGKIDMPGSYEVIRRVITTYADPKAARLMVDGTHEVAGIVPLGAAYPIVSDRRLNSVEALAGKRLAAFDHDKAQAAMIQRIGAQPVSADITNFSTKFNNGSVDFIAAPTVAYKPLELSKGIGKNGAIIRFPLMILTYQVIINRSRFPEGFGVQARGFWLSRFDAAMREIAAADASIPPATWLELSAENAFKYTLMLREARVDLAKNGLYDKRGLKVLKRVRCTLAPADSECIIKSEED